MNKVPGNISNLATKAHSPVWVHPNAGPGGSDLLTHSPKGVPIPVPLPQVIALGVITSLDPKGPGGWPGSGSPGLRDPIMAIAIVQGAA